MERDGARVRAGGGASAAADASQGARGEWWCPRKAEARRGVAKGKGALRLEWLTKRARTSVAHGEREGDVRRALGAAGLDRAA